MDKGTQIHPSNQDVDFKAYKDLWLENLVTAEPVVNPTNDTIGCFFHNGVASAGFALLEQHRAETTSTGWLKANRNWLLKQGITFTVGYALGWLTAWIKQM